MCVYCHQKCANGFFVGIKSRREFLESTTAVSFSNNIPITAKKNSTWTRQIKFRSVALISPLLITRVLIRNSPSWSLSNACSGIMNIIGDCVSPNSRDKTGIGYGWMDGRSEAATWHVKSLIWNAETIVIHGSHITLLISNRESKLSAARKLYLSSFYYNSSVWLDYKTTAPLMMMWHVGLCDSVAVRMESCTPPIR